MDYWITRVSHIYKEKTSVTGLGSKLSPGRAPATQIPQNSHSILCFTTFLEQQGMERPLLLHSISIKKWYKNGGIVKKEAKGAAKKVKCLQIDSSQAPGEVFKATKKETQGKSMTGIKKKRAWERTKGKGHSRTVGWGKLLEKKKRWNCSQTWEIEKIINWAWQSIKHNKAAQQKITGRVEKRGNLFKSEFFFFFQTHRERAAWQRVWSGK